MPPFAKLLTAYRLEKDLKKADKSISKAKPNARFRPVSHLAEVDNQGQSVTAAVKPYWLQVRPRQAQVLEHHDDFRHELNVEHYPNKTLIWDVYAADYHKAGKAKASWQALGEIRLTESVVSKSCDTQLHFAHPTLDSRPY